MSPATSRHASIDPGRKSPRVMELSDPLAAGRVGEEAMRLAKEEADKVSTKK